MMNNNRSVFDLGEDLKTKTSSGKFYDEFIDIYSFLQIFQDLLESLNLLAKNDEELDKIVLQQEYPDTTFKEGHRVIYKINERNFYDPTSVISPSGRKQRKPLTLDVSSDIISNNIVEDKAYYFCNKIEFEIFSNSVNHVHTLAKLLESICFQYKKNLKIYVYDMTYEGQSKLDYNDKYFDKRLFSKSIFFEVITCETFKRVSEELKYIEIN